MPPRANWKGYLRLSLVSCPIALYPASSLSEKVSFNRINRKTGNRLKQQNVDAETGDVVPREDTARGYEIGKGQYLIVEDEELEAVQIESTRTIEIDEFVPRKEIDDRYIDSPYYIAPDGQVGQDGRYVPAVRAYFDHQYGLDRSGDLPFAPDGAEDFDGWKQRQKHRV